MIKLRIGRSEIIYSDEDLMNMSRVQLKQLKQDLQCNIEEVSAKKAKYQAENSEEYNSKEYLLSSLVIVFGGVLVSFISVSKSVAVPIQ